MVVSQRKSGCRAKSANVSPHFSTQPMTGQLKLSSAAAPVRENEHSDARALGFAVYDVELK